MTDDGTAAGGTGTPPDKSELQARRPPAEADVTAAPQDAGGGPRRQAGRADRSPRL